MSVSRAVHSSSSSALAKTPPLRVTVDSPVARRARRDSSATARATPRWKRAASTGTSVPSPQIGDQPLRTGAGSNPPAVMPKAYAEESARQAELTAASSSTAAWASYPARWHRPTRTTPRRRATHAGGRHAGDALGQLPLQERQFVTRAGGDARQVRVPSHTGGPQPGQRQTARVGHTGVSAGERGRGQMSEASVARVVGEQDLAAPHGAVVAVPGAVERDADHGRGAVEAVLGHGRGDVRVVMLDIHGCAPGQAARRMGPLDRVVSRVPVGGDEWG